MAIAKALCFIFVIVAFVPWASATDYIVGGSSNWTKGVNYDNWVAGKTFRVGDTLVFNYNTAFHSVYEVSASDYASCSSSNPIRTSKTGQTNITLSDTNTHYFICATPTHCTDGMKLSVTATSSSSTTPSATSPTTSSSPAPSSPTTPGSGSVSPSGAHSLSPSSSQLMVGLVCMLVLRFMFL